MANSYMGIRALVDKVMDDQNFYDALRTDPAAALRSVGIEPTPQQILALKNIDYESLGAVAKAFGPDRGIVT